MRHLLPLVLASASGLLCAQGVFNNADKPGDPICPMIEADKTSLSFGAYGANTSGGLRGANTMDLAWHQRGTAIYPKDQRKDVSRFTAYDEKGKPVSIASLKGKIVLVGLWSHRCDPSARMIMELASVYPNREKFNFEVLAVNFDTTRRDINNGIPGGWEAIKLFQTRNRDFFTKSKLPFYIPGVGAEGTSQMFDQIKSLPVLMVVDGEGRLASVDIGYEPNMVAQRLSIFIREAKGELKIETAPAQPQPQPQQPQQPPPGK
ncbi:MAG TPA: TlpA disulfide reductase family protein [Holophagaceae bacterium]|nr:TlpA disulfide reductase family protein [Holophagaceae bacterium]